jgi:predicted phage terminase large subunit-like protein
LFNDVHHYDTLPASYRVTIGIDLAYTVKKHADHSVAVVAARDPAGVFYILHVERRQCAAPDFALTLATLRARFPGATLASYVSGTERGSLDFMARQGAPVTPLTARADKFTRAQLTAAAWNAGRILLPREGRWLNPFVEEIAGFTGVNDRHDDQVDALVSAFDATAGHARGAAMIAALRARLGGGDALGAALASPPTRTLAEAIAALRADIDRPRRAAG